MQKIAKSTKKLYVYKIFTLSFHSRMLTCYLYHYVKYCSQGAAMENESEFKNDIIEGRNAIIEALRAGRTIDKIYICY